MLAGVLQPLDHLPLDGGSHSLGGGGSDVVSCSLQHVLAAGIARAGGTLLGGLHHVGSGVSQGLGGGQQALLTMGEMDKLARGLIKLVNIIAV